MTRKNLGTLISIHSQDPGRRCLTPPVPYCGSLYRGSLRRQHPHLASALLNHTDPRV
jgi:hypothetical protein